MGNAKKLNFNSNLVGKSIDMFDIEMALFKGDCLKVMDELIDKGVKVDAVITDPPYGISKSNGFKSLGRTGIDFGAWDHHVDLFSYIDRVYELLKAGGTFIAFCDWRKAGQVADYCEGLGFLTKDRIQFKKDNPTHPNSDRRYACDREDAIWFVKPGMTPAVPRGKKWTFNTGESSYLRPEFSAGVARCKKGSQRHPCQKPVSLMEDILKVHTNEGDVVLDCYMGSGTTGIACRNTNRHFIGIELDDSYFDLAEERIFLEL